MARLNVNPTRMELSKLKKKLISARRGHKLLKDKRDELMRQFMNLIRENRQLRTEVEAAIKKANKYMAVAGSVMQREVLETALMLPKQEVELEVSEKNVMSVYIPIGSIFDGIQRPLDDIRKVCGNNLQRGVEVPSLKREPLWKFTPSVKKGDRVIGGDIIGTVPETDIVLHKIMVPNGVEGTVKSISEGEFHANDIVCVVETTKGDMELSLIQKWPVRRGRPYNKKLSPEMPLVTGQRVVDCLFPIAKGGVAAIPGPFGSGKTVTQHQLAKWAEADIIVYLE